MSDLGVSPLPTGSEARGCNRANGITASPHPKHYTSLTRSPKIIKPSKTKYNSTIACLAAPYAASIMMRFSMLIRSAGSETQTGPSRIYWQSPSGANRGKPGKNTPTQSGSCHPMSYHAVLC